MLLRREIVNVTSAAANLRAHADQIHTSGYRLTTTPLPRIGSSERREVNGRKSRVKELKNREERDRPGGARAAARTVPMRKISTQRASAGTSVGIAAFKPKTSRGREGRSCRQLNNKSSLL